MAVIIGFLTQPVSYSGIVNPHVSSDLIDFELAWWPPHNSIVSASPQGTLTTTWPVSANGVAKTGFLSSSYSDDFYHRIHIIPSRIDLGNIVSTQTNSVRVWNAFFVAQTLLNIVNPDEGIELSGQSSPPLVFNALHEREWQVAITTDGAAVLNTQIQWVFSNGSVAKLPITGNRITAFPWRIDWTDGVDEKLTWATDILQSESCAEQRRALRLTPRRNLSAKLFVDKRERQFFDLAMFGWGSRVWAVPVWFDIQLTASAISAGAVLINCDTLNRDFRVGGLAMLLGETAFQFETVEILSITSTQLGLKRPVASNWAVGSRLYPVRTARLESSTKMRRMTDELQSTTVDFVVVEPCEWPAVMPATNYRGYPVFDAAPDETDDLTSQYERLLLELDNGSAPVVVTDTAELSLPVIQHRWVLYGRTEHAVHRSLLYALNGRQKAVWIPTHADDLTLVTVVADAATAIQITAIGYTRFAQVKTGRKDIRLQLHNGTVYYRRIIGASEISADIEQLQIDTPFGVQIFPADVYRISWMSLMRADSDSVKITHETDADGLATSQHIFKGVIDDEL